MYTRRSGCPTYLFVSDENIFKQSKTCYKIIFINSLFIIYYDVLKIFNIVGKKMFNQDEEKMECAVGNREMGVWQYKKAEIVLI